LAVANWADDDPWRRRMRDPAVRKDRAELERLATEEIVHLTGKDEGQPQPRANLVLLGVLLRSAGMRATAERLLRHVQQRHPDDFRVNFTLARTLDSQQPDLAAEAVGFYRAALALRPESAKAYNNLGLLWKGLRGPAEGEPAYRQAILVQPTYALAYNNLGNLLREQQKPAEAEAVYRQAILVQPHDAKAYYNLGLLLKA